MRAAATSPAPRAFTGAARLCATRVHEGATPARHPMLYHVCALARLRAPRAFARLCAPLCAHVLLSK